MPSQPVDPDRVKRWIALLRSHKNAIAAMDFFTVPTASLRMLYVFFVIEHGRRCNVHFNAAISTDFLDFRVRVLDTNDGIWRVPLGFR